MNNRQASKVRDRLWLWGHPVGSHDIEWGLPAPSKVTPAEAASYLGVPNMVMVVYGDKPEPPFDESAKELSSLSRVVWSIIGDSGSKRNDANPDLDAVLDLSNKFLNITGAIMDDFFHEPDENGSVSRCTIEQLSEFQSQLHGATHPLDLWSVLYTHDLHLPITDYLRFCDVITFWTWHANELSSLAENFERAEQLLPRHRKVLGCYMWDYGTNSPMPVEAMEHQCTLALDWLREGRIEGIIFLASCICDIGLPAVEWTREWISRIGDQAV